MYAADIGVTAEGTDFDSCVATIKEAIEIKLGTPVHMIQLEGHMKFSSN